jgi:hypothetical protein
MDELDLPTALIC